MGKTPYTTNNTNRNICKKYNILEINRCENASPGGEAT
jgi:hypothetical protein